MKQQPTLNVLKPGEHAFIHSLHCTGALRRRLLDMGVIPDTPIECLCTSLWGDPSAFLIRGTVIAIRATDCQLISIYTR